MVGLQELARRLRAAKNTEEFIELIRSGDVDFIDLRFVDLPGRWHHVTIPTTRLSPALFTRGTGFDGSSIPGFTSIESGDMVLLPVRSTATGEEYGDNQIVAMIATAADPDSKEPFALDPRVIAGRAEDALRQSGHADESLWSPELEFYLFSGVSFNEAPNGAHYRVSSTEAGWPEPGSDEPDLGYRIRPRSGYHATPPSDSHFEIRNEITARMEETGIPVRYHHHENGAPGQLEIEVEGEPLVQAADHVMWSKYIVRNTALDWDLSATFMPKPLPWEPGSGLHFHIKLMRDGNPVFHADKGYAGLSEKALFFIGGILQHGRALAAVTSPSTNSYRRLRPGYEAPTNLFFSAANRSAAIRIPKYANEPLTKTIEYRPSDASGNPYLTMAALLAAGLDGLENRMDPRENGFGPIDTNIHDLPMAERDKIVPLPVTLEEALIELASDCAFLSDTGIFPEAFVSSWIGLKRRESEEIGARPHPAEYGLYFDC
jgi:glutamine synthetase